jgi:hypothetical protein
MKSPKCKTQTDTVSDLMQTLPTPQASTKLSHRIVRLKMISISLKASMHTLLCRRRFLFECKTIKCQNFNQTTTIQDCNIKKSIEIHLLSNHRILQIILRVIHLGRHQLLLLLKRNMRRIRELLILQWMGSV